MEKNYDNNYFGKLTEVTGGGVNPKQVRRQFLFTKEWFRASFAQIHHWPVAR